MKYLFDLLSRTADGVFAVDRHQRIAFWNRSAKRMLGFDTNAVLGCNCFEIMQGLDKCSRAFCKRRCDVLQAAEQRDPPATVDLQVNTQKDSRTWISVSTLLLPSRWSGLTLLVHQFRGLVNNRPHLNDLAQSLPNANSASDSLDTPPLLEPLTPKEHEVLILLAAGASTETISHKLGIQKTTVRTHVQHLLLKLGVHSRLEAVAAALQQGLV